jgi:hypothetical protein
MCGRFWAPRAQVARIIYTASDVKKLTTIPCGVAEILDAQQKFPRANGFRGVTKRASGKWRAGICWLHAGRKVGLGVRRDGGAAAADGGAAETACAPRRRCRAPRAAATAGEANRVGGGIQYEHALAQQRDSDRCHSVSTCRVWRCTEVRAARVVRAHRGVWGMWKWWRRAWGAFSVFFTLLRVRCGSVLVCVLRVRCERIAGLGFVFFPRHGGATRFLDARAFFKCTHRQELTC